MECLNGDDIGSKLLSISHSISHSDNFGLCMATTDELPILIETAGNFVKNPNCPATFHGPKMYTSAKAFPKELRAVFVNHRIDSDLEFVEF